MVVYVECWVCGMVCDVGFRDGVRYLGVGFYIVFIELNFNRSIVF